MKKEIEKMNLLLLKAKKIIEFMTMLILELGLKT